MASMNHATQPKETQRGWIGRVALVGALIAALAVPLSGWRASPAVATPPPAPVLHQWPSSVTAGDIALGPDGNLWFVASGLVNTVTKTGLGKITPAGTITTYLDIWGGHCATYFCQPNRLRFIGDQLYVSEDFEGTIWRFSIASGAPVAAATPVVSPGSHTPREITDVGGYLYVTNYDGVAYFPADLSSGLTCWSGPPFTYDTNGIAVGPDGNIWTADGGDIGMVAPCTSGAVSPTYYTAGLSPQSNVEDIVAADGALWFTNSIPASSTPVQDSIGRITTAGVITEYPVPTEVAAHQVGILGQMAVASDGSIWFTESNLGQVGRFWPSDPSTILEYAMPDATRVNFLATGPDGNMWYSGWSPSSGDVIGELSLTGAPATQTSTTLTSSRNPSTYGQAVTLNATVTPSSGLAVPTGNVTFVLDGQSHTVALDAAGHAAYTMGATDLAVGLHPITASYAPAAGSGFSPSTSAVLQQRVQAAGARPDGWIRRMWADYIGNDIFNTSASQQTVLTEAHRAGVRTFRVRVYNDGAGEAVITVKATGSSRDVDVRYFSHGREVTNAITSAAGLSFTRPQGGYKGFRVRIKVGRGADIGSQKFAKVTARSGAGAGLQKDAVKAVVTVTRR
jgi:streptogramin lyase